MRERDMLASMILKMMVSGGKKVAEQLEAETMDPQGQQEALGD